MGLLVESQLEDSHFPISLDRKEASLKIEQIPTDPKTLAIKVELSNSSSFGRAHRLM